jgi:hypothetical protein
LVGFDGTTYPIELGEGEPCLLALAKGLHEISTVDTVADVAGALGGLYFDLEDVDGTVRVWIDVDNLSSAPAAPGGGRLLEVDIVTADTADAVAAAIQAVLEADAAFSATVLADVVTVTDATFGTRTNVAAGTSGFTVGTTQNGTTGGGTVHVKAATVPLSVKVAVTPA